MGLYTFGMFLFALATESWMMFVFLIPYCLGGIAGPAMQAVISSQVPANEQGEIQGMLSSLMSASAIIGPPMMSMVFTILHTIRLLFICRCSFCARRGFNVNKHCYSFLLL